MKADLDRWMSQLPEGVSVCPAAAALRLAMLATPAVKALGETW